MISVVAEINTFFSFLQNSTASYDFVENNEKPVPNGKTVSGYVVLVTMSGGYIVP